LSSWIQNASSRGTWLIVRLNLGFYCFGRLGKGVLSVRFTYRDKVIRIIGAGYWRKGKKVYETQRKLHR
jgi:hypothetical protein